MSMSAKLRRAPVRIVTGGYILNSGLSKLNADDDAAKTMHSAASGTYSFLGNVQPRALARGLGLGEIAVGAVVLLPIVSPAVAGAALIGFSGAVLNMYWRTPGMHREGSPLPTAEGTPLAKDVWLLGMGLGLLADAALEPAHDKVIELEAVAAEKRASKTRRARRKARKARKAVRGATPSGAFLKSARDAAIDVQSDAAKRAQKAAKKAQKRAEKASELAAKRLSDMRAEYGPAAAEKARTAGDAARQWAEEYGPVAAEKARSAGDTTRQWAEEYGPVVAEKARSARDTARQWAEEYGPVAAEKARGARDVARQAAEDLGPVAAEKARAARDTARQWAEEYGPIAAEKARVAAEAAKHAAEEAGAKVRDKVS
jgi:uncharacterized membrane protein YphA (DoxX/SURF4 family)